jgi:hypothetical protein
MLVQAGLVTWNGGSLARIAPVAQIKGTRSVSELLLEERA